MHYAISFIPEDRRVAYKKESDFPQRPRGTALFADLSGFTTLTEAYVSTLGPRLGAEAATRQLNKIYADLMAALHQYDGSAVSFSGDGVLCWFGEPTTAAESAPHLATMAAFAMHRSMRKHKKVQLDNKEAIENRVSIPMGMKTTIVTGVASRFLVGDPVIQRFDVLAGAVVDQAAEAEHLARQGEILVDRTTLATVEPLVRITARRTGASGHRYYTVERKVDMNVPTQKPALNAALPQAVYEQWLLPSIRARLSSHQSEHLGDLRPAVALFIRLDKLDFDGDERAPEMLASYIKWVQHTLERFGGALIQVTTGDKGGYLYASFGAPVAYRDPEVRAASAALALQGNGPETSPYQPSVRMGLAQGRMRVGPYGSDTRRTFGVQGSAANLASRLMAAAQPGQIILDRVLASRLQDDFHIADTNEISVKGYLQPIDVSALGSRRSSVRFSTIAHQPPLVGRTDELTILQGQLEHVHKNGLGRIIRLEGEAGVGKSRLLTAFEKQIERQSISVAAGASQQIERETSHMTMRQIMRQLLKLSSLSDASPEDQITHVRTVIEKQNQNWLLLLPLLGDLLGLPIADNATTKAFEPQLRRQALTTLILEILQQKARERQLVLLLEDAHWLDEASLDLLQALARVIRELPLLIVLSHRPAEDETEGTVEALVALPNQSSLVLEPLSADSIEALLTHHLGGPVSSLTISLFERQTKGNPFFVEELASALAEDGHLLPDSDGIWSLSPSVHVALQQSRALMLHENEWRLSDADSLVDAIPGLPDSIHGAVLARFDNLRSSEQFTLKSASVIGRDFSHELLLEIVPSIQNLSTVRHQCTHLAARDFLHETDSGLAFKHHITQQIVYRSLLEEQRREIHQRVGEALERSQSDTVEQLAHHFFNAPVSEPSIRAKALNYLDKAAQSAKRDYANEAALHYVDRAITLESDWQRWLIRVQLLHTLGRREEEVRTLEKLDGFQVAPSIQRAFAWADLYESTSEYEEAIAQLENALSIARRDHDMASEARCLARLGLITWRHGDYTAAEARYISALTLLDTDNQSQDWSADIYYGLGLVYRQQGRYDEAQFQFDLALSHYRSVGDRQNEAKTLIAIGNIAHYRERLDEAMQAYSTALPLYRSTGDRAGLGSGLLSLAQGLGSRGDHGRSIAMLREALEVFEGVDDLWSQCIVWHDLGIEAMMLGQLEEAEQHFIESMRISKQINGEHIYAYAQCNLGQVMRDLGKRNEASTLFSDGLAWAMEHEDRLLEATLLSEIARLHLMAGVFQKAIDRAIRSSECYQSLKLDDNATTNLVIEAMALWQSSQLDDALPLCFKAVQALSDGADGVVTFPQRDYLNCAQIFAAAGLNTASAEAMALARRLTNEQATRISDDILKEQYLSNHAFNVDILNGIPAD